MWDVGGKIIRRDENYIVKDNSTLKSLSVSSTELMPNKSTRGHAHAGQEEVYIFVKGGGRMNINEDDFIVQEGDIIYIQDGDYHRVHAGNEGCYFICVFDGVRKHGNSNDTQSK